MELDHTGLGLKSTRKGQTTAYLLGAPFEGWMAEGLGCVCVCVFILAAVLFDF